MNTFWQLNKFVKKVINLAIQENIEFEIATYSPRNGFFIKINYSELGWFSTQNKYIISFNKDSFKKLLPLLKKYHPELKEGQDSLQKNNLYGYDIFQEVDDFYLTSYLAKSSKKFNLYEFNKQKSLWLNAQITFNKKYPDIFNEDILDSLYKSFEETEKYLENNNTVTVSRISGISHKISFNPIKLDRNTFSKLGNISYRPVVFIFSTSNHLPEGHFNSNSNASRPKNRNRKDKISTQYASNPYDFDFYTQAGIFEIFKKKS